MKQQILIVEDSMINQKILRKILEEKYNILCAYNGQEALQIIEEKYRHLAGVILDLQMPVMDRQKLMKILQQTDKYMNLPILVATGSSSKTTEQECLRLGAWDFVTKTYDEEVIKFRLNNIIARSQIQLVNQIKLLSERDYLTDIYNRRFFMQQMEELIKSHPETTYVLIRMDVDNFRLYNSSFGTEAGDQLLIYIAEELKKLENPEIVYGRIESDVFCVCVPYNPERLDRKLMQSEKAIKTLNIDFRLKMSFGIYVITDVNLEMEKMYSCATVASKACKKNVNTVYKYYTEEMQRQEEKIQQITKAFDTAVKEEQFQIYLQPKYALESELACGAEALVRWMHPRLGMISPGDFIPVYEKNGQIIELDYYMWEKVCQLLRRWMEKEEPYPVSVNISRISMYNPKVVDQLVELTEKYQIPRHLLNLEITESAYMSNPGLMKSIISKLRRLGFVILMDDFGSGYSSLNTLKNIEVDILKIDMKFLPTGNENAKSEKILASVIRMAGWIGMPVIVEGVETREQKDFLDSIGCSYVQGYFYARPMPVSEYEELIENQKTAEGLEKIQELPQMEALDTIWSSDSEAVALLKSVSLPFIIFEYDKKQMEILRMNQAYMKSFGNSSNLAKYLNHQEWCKLQEAIQQVEISRGDAECECLFVLPDGGYRWHRIRLFFIGNSVNTSIISATFSDVTTERKLEKELNTVFGMLKTRKKQRQSILIVDDSELSREILIPVFQKDYDILEAADGQEALQILEKKREQVAVILLDMQMPGMDGQEFLFYKNQMANMADIPVVVISSDSAENSQIHMLENGVNDYITKPFISAMVKRRVENVIEYSGRFRDFVQEYQNAHENENTEKLVVYRNGYSIGLLKQFMDFMGEIFELVRLIDPTSTSVVEILPDLTVSRTPYSCFKIWDKKIRCENCSGLCSHQGQCVISKYELLKNDVFYVVSHPVKLYLTEDITEELVVEVSSRISDTQKMRMMGKESFIDIVENTQKLIYTDPLTEAFNRRYMEEMLFLSHGQTGVAKKIGLIMLDLYKFKQINDLFGHHTGDRILKETVAAIKNQVRRNDSVIRYGGDEFIVTMTNCEETHVVRAIERIRKAIGSISYGPNKLIYAKADFGYVYTDNFVSEQEFLTTMIKTADEKMYQEKKKHREMQEQ